MAAALGRDLRIKYDSTGGGTYVAVAGAKSDDLTITNEGVDITDKDDSGWQTFLDAPGRKTIGGTVEGVLVSDEFIALAMSNTKITGAFEIDVTDLGTLTGVFALTEVQVTGAEGAEATTFTATLASSGAITWTGA